MQLWGDAVVLYASKLFSQGETRDHFRNDPCKYVTIAGWHILVDVNTLARDFTFQLTDPIRRNVYQFRTGKSVNLCPKIIGSVLIFPKKIRNYTMQL